jgi:hypothetical protein
VGCGVCRQREAGGSGQKSETKPPGLGFVHAASCCGVVSCAPLEKTVEGNEAMW